MARQGFAWIIYIYDAYEAYYAQAVYLTDKEAREAVEAIQSLAPRTELVLDRVLLNPKVTPAPEDKQLWSVKLATNDSESTATPVETADDFYTRLNTQPVFSLIAEGRGDNGDICVFAHSAQEAIDTARMWEWEND